MNILLYVTASEMLVFIGYTIVTGKKQQQEKLDRFYMLSKNKVEVIPCSAGWLSMQVGVLLLVIFMTIYVSQHPEQSGSADATGFMIVCAGLLIILVLNMSLMKKYQELYVNKDGFMDDGKVIRYTSIKSIDPSLTNCTVTTYSNQELKISSAKGKALMKLLDEREQAKNTKK